MAPAENEDRSRHSRRTDPTQRSATAFACGVRTGVFTTVNSFGPDDLVERSEELRVSIPEQDVLVLEASDDREVPSLLGDPG